MKQLFIVRHGQTAYNKQKIVQGRGINADLNETGREQAAQFYQAYKDEPFDKIYASNLKRSQQSIANFVEEGRPLNIRPNLDEISWGKYEGQKLSSEMKLEFEKLRHQWYAGNTSVTMPKGESADDLSNRVQVFLQGIAETDAKKILICSHGRTIRIMMCLLTGVPIADMRTYDPENLALYQVNWEPPKLGEIVKNNFIEHLEKIQKSK